MLFVEKDLAPTLLFWLIVAGPILNIFCAFVSNGFEIFDGRCILSFAWMCSVSIDNLVFCCARFADIGASVIMFAIFFPFTFQDRIQLLFFLWKVYTLTLLDA